MGEVLFLLFDIQRYGYDILIDDKLKPYVPAYVVHH